MGHSRLRQGPVRPTPIGRQRDFSRRDSRTGAGWPGMNAAWTWRRGRPARRPCFSPDRPHPPRLYPQFEARPLVQPALAADNSRGWTLVALAGTAEGQPTRSPLYWSSSIYGVFMSAVGNFKLLVLAGLAFVGTLVALPEASGWNILFLLGLLPFEFGLVMIAARNLHHLAKEAAEEKEVQAEVAADSVTAPCPRCGRLNSVRTRICPRCEQHL